MISTSFSRAYANLPIRRNYFLRHAKYSTCLRTTVHKNGLLDIISTAELNEIKPCCSLFSSQRTRLGEGCKITRLQDCTDVMLSCSHGDSWSRSCFDKRGSCVVVIGYDISPSALVAWSNMNGKASAISKTMPMRANTTLVMKKLSLRATITFVACMLTRLAINRGETRRAKKDSRPECVSPL
jgi:hypothetical protein